MKFLPKYERTILFQNKDVEVILIDWEPGAETPIHDHGKSHGLIRVLKGNLNEDIFSPFTLKEVFFEKYTQGVIVVERPNTIHKMKNSGKTRAQSLHIYTPKLVMREYKVKGGKK